jgi:hypothetical protein
MNYWYMLIMIMNDQIDDRYDVWYGMTIWWTKCLLLFHLNGNIMTK